MSGGTDDYAVIADRVVGDISRQAQRDDGPAFALFTGDAVDRGGNVGDAPAESVTQIEGATASNGPAKQRRWRELVADPLAASGVPLFAAVGAQDLAAVRPCVPLYNVC